MVCIIWSLIEIIPLLKSCNGDINNNLITMWIEIFGISLTGILLPIMVATISLFLTEKRFDMQISEMLAQGANIRLILIKLPLGLWYDLASHYYQSISESSSSVNPLSDYKYGIHLVFCGSFFQRFHLKVLQAWLSNKPGDLGHSIWTPNLDASEQNFVIADSTGVAPFFDKKTNGTNITLFISNELNANINDVLINIMEQNAVVSFDLKFKRAEEAFGIRWEQFKECYFPFPFIRGIYNFLVNIKMKYSFCRFSLFVNRSKPVDNRKVQLIYNIYHIEIADKRSRLDKKATKPKVN